MKVVTFYEEKIFQGKSRARSRGWDSQKRLHVVVAVAAAAAGWLVSEWSGGAEMSAALVGSLAGGFFFILTLLLSRGFVFRPLERMLEMLQVAAQNRGPLAPESLQRDGGARWAELAETINGLIGLVRAENAAAPLAAYRESFLSSETPAYLCDFSAGRLLDCNRAFADFIGWDREAVVTQRLGDLVLAGSAQSPTGSAMELRFRHASGDERRAVVFLRPVRDVAQGERVIHCATVVPQAESEEKAG